MTEERAPWPAADANEDAKKCANTSSDSPTAISPDAPLLQLVAQLAESNRLLMLLLQQNAQMIELLASSEQEEIREFDLAGRPIR